MMRRDIKRDPCISAHRLFTFFLLRQKESNKEKGDRKNRATAQSQRELPFSEGQASFMSLYLRSSSFKIGIQQIFFLGSTKNAERRDF